MAFGELNQKLVEDLRHSAVGVTSLMRRWKKWVLETDPDGAKYYIRQGWFDVVEDVVKAKYKIDYQVRRRVDSREKILEAEVKGEDASEFLEDIRDADERIVILSLKIKSALVEYEAYEGKMDVPVKKSPGRPPKSAAFDNESEWFGKFDGEEEVYRDE